MKYRYSVTVAMLAFALVSCGKANTDTKKSDSTVTSGTPVVPAGTVVPTPTYTPPVGATGVSDWNSYCPANYTHPVYVYYRTATGQNSVSTTYNDITADHKLRVSVEPQASGATVGAGGSAGYTKMSYTVTLLRNGSVVATKALNLPTTTLSDGTVTANGLAINTKSNPALADFTDVIGQYPGSHYSIKIDGVKTDTTCKNYCGVNSPYYAGNCISGWDPNAQYYCGYYSQYGYTWTTDYNTNQVYCCNGTQVKDCNRLNCGVGPAKTSETWNVKVYVETDNTPCITQ